MKCFTQLFFSLIRVPVTLALLPIGIAQASVNPPAVYNCQSADGHQTGRFVFSQGSRFYNSAMIECNGGVGDPMANCRGVTSYYEQKMLSLALSTSSQPFKTQFPVTRYVQMNNRTPYFSGHFRFLDNHGYDISLLSPNGPSASGYRLFITIFAGQPFQSPILARLLMECQEAR